MRLSSGIYYFLIRFLVSTISMIAAVSSGINLDASRLFIRPESIFLSLIQNNRSMNLFTKDFNRTRFIILRFSLCVGSVSKVLRHMFGKNLNFIGPSHSIQIPQKHRKKLSYH